MVINLSSQHMYSAHYYDSGTLIRLSIVSPHPTSHIDPTLLEDGLVVLEQWLPWCKPLLVSLDIPSISLPDSKWTVLATGPYKEKPFA